MDLIEIKPSTHLNFSLPNILISKLTLYNITLHQLNLRIYSSHPTNFIITPNHFIMDSFDEKVVNIQLKYYQESSVSNFLANKMVLYVYDYDQEGELWNKQGVLKDKYNKLQKIEFQISCTAEMQGYCLKQQQRKQLLLRLSKLSEGLMTSIDKSKLIQYLEGLGDLISFHSLIGDVFIAQYKSLYKTVSQIIEFQSSNGQMVLYAIGALPWIIYPDKTQQPQITRKKSLSQLENRKSHHTKSKRSFDATHSMTQIIQIPKNQRQSYISHQTDKQQQVKQTSKQQDKLQQQQQQHFEQQKVQQLTQQQISQFDEQAPFRSGIRLQSKQYDKIKEDSCQQIKIQPIQQITQQQLQQVLKQQKTTIATKSKRKNNNAFESFAQRDPKASFSKRTKRRNKSLEIKTRKTSDQILEQSEQEQDEDYKALFMEESGSKNKSSNSNNTETYLENIQVINSIIKPLNFILLKDGRFIILFEDFVVLYSSIEKVGSGEKINLGPSPDWKNKKTVMKAVNDRLVITCNWAFYIIDLKTKKTIQGYVQRKQILDFLIHEKQNILILGGITHSKLSLFGKQTGRSNIKTYSLINQYHLYTFDFPTQGDIYHLGQLGTTESKIVAANGVNNKVNTLYFLNVVNATKIQILSKFQMQELAVSEIKDLKLVQKSIYVLQDMKNQQIPLMFVKKFNIKFQDRPSISTESLPIQHGSYSSMAMDGTIILLADTDFKQLIIYVIKKRKYIKISFQGKFIKMQVRYPYLFIMYDTHIQVKRLRIQTK